MSLGMGMGTIARPIRFIFTSSQGVFHGQSIRVVMLDGQRSVEPWFVAADVCRALHLNMNGGTFPHLKPLAPDEKQMVRNSTHNLTMGSLPNAGVTCISESGLYKLVMRSDKPEARQFQDWVTRDVLPAIRKDGGYRR